MQPTTANAIHSWLAQLRFLGENHECLAPNFWRPFHFATLALQIARAGTPTLGMPDKVAAYAARMRLWQAIGLASPTSVIEHDPRGKFVPLERLDDRREVNASAVKLAAISTTYGADRETTNSLEISLNEIMENCFAHAEVASPLQGLACAQSWPRGSLAQIAIADCGIGVRESLSRNANLVERLEVMNGCELATQFGVTGKPGMGHAGYGLALTRQLLEANGGTLIVQSGSEWFSTAGRTLTTGHSMFRWPGTLVVLEWNCERPLRVKDVYSSWPTVGGYSDDDFDF